MIAPRVVGVDEYAPRKGRHYGAVLSDVETRRPVDLLPDREASSRAGLARRTAGRPPSSRTVAVWILRRPETLPDWLAAVRQDDMPSLHTLAAVIAGLALPWSSGTVEGHVNRIKMIKRQMYGRVGFNLLHKWVLLAS
ncbi:hypothetical protein ACFYX6_06260 [Streptomyces bacillaris]|uniref:Transposase n=1 Tax=Streptomyces cavourensis TaxID=67258 RepID=A0ABY5FIC9_9ACTN|nr:hypothetical protein [Streptomyces cavourensis]UTR83523.1 hypothetical protein NLU04_07415 [Streptomyces cavourensis]